LNYKQWNYALVIFLLLAMLCMGISLYKIEELRAQKEYLLTALEYEQTQRKLIEEKNENLEILVDIYKILDFLREEIESEKEDVPEEKPGILNT